MTRVLVNGEDVDAEGHTTLDELADALGVADRGSAIAVDGEVVPRARWADTPLRDAMRIRIVSAVQGG